MGPRSRLGMGWMLAFVALGANACAEANAETDAAVESGQDAQPLQDAARLDAGPSPAPTPELGRHEVALLDTRLIVPSEGLPMETPTMHSNNNLDIIRFDGRVFLSWRASGDHFAGAETLIHVVSSRDEMTWDFEGSFSLSTDLREPRFLVLNGTLFLYVSVLGVDNLAFEPMGVSVSQRNVDGSWSPLEDIGLPGYVAWRTRTERGVPYMMAYQGGENIYLFNGEPLSVDLLTTTDGRSWTAVNPERRTVYQGGGSESDFVIADDGMLYGVIRNEAGDTSGFGSEVCRAPAEDLAAWECHVDPRKYDSPLMFYYDGEAYLVGRRNVSETGHYDLQTGRGDQAAQALANQVDYTGRPKRCSLWRFVPGDTAADDRIAYILDLPSRGDTCFPAWVPGDSPDEIILYNYSSPIDGPDVAWNVGQRGDTYIYRHVLRFSPL